MKLFFGADITHDENNIDFECGHFATRRITAEQERALVEREKLIKAVNDEFELSDAATNIGAISILATLLGVIIMIENLIEMPWKDFWKSELAIGGIIWIAVFGIITAIYFWRLKEKRKRACQDERVQRDIERIETIAAECCKTLDVPEDASLMDGLACLYRVKDGKIIIKKNKGDSFVNAAFRVFRTDEALCVAPIGVRWDIPLAEITGIRMIKKRVLMSGWNKETLFNKGEYKKYKMALASGGGIILKYYYALCITRNGEDYELYFPPYELPVIEKLTGIRAEM